MPLTDREWLEKYRADTLSAAERAAFERRPDYDELMRLSASSASPKAAFPWRWIATGGGIVVVLLMWIFWPRTPAGTHRAAPGEKHSGHLPDGSRFALNAGSELHYQPKRWARDRRVQLTGEAFFAVEAGSTFTVETELGAISVLGTQFNVRTWDDRLAVSCHSGRVELIAYGIERTAVLDSGRALTYVPGEGFYVQASTPAATAWLEGFSPFRDAPLGMVLDELERQYDVTVVAGGIDLSQPLSCTFRHQQLELALKKVLEPLNLGYRIAGQTIYLQP